MISFLDLPSELILHALWFLDIADILACQLTHRLLCAIIRDSILLKYLSALRAAGMDDNRLCPVRSMYERSCILNLREDAWAGHRIDFSQKILVPEDLMLTRSYGLDGGMYFFLEHNNPFSLHYVSLPSPVSGIIRWNRIDVDFQIIAVGLAIYEHDLIAIVNQLLTNNGKRWVRSGEISLFEASTGKPHPLAKKAKILAPSPPNEIKIRGDHLLAFNYREQIYIYEWKTGIPKMTISVPGRTFSGCLFLSPKVLLLPNRRNNTLELWDIPELPVTEPKAFPNSALGLPPITIHSTVIELLCYSEPFSGSHGWYSHLPFYPSPADAIAIITVGIDTDYVDGVERVFFFKMFVHHRSLLEFCSAPIMLEESSAGANAVITPWDKWGPAVTRFIRSDTPLEPCSAAANQRCAYVNDNGEIVVLDFNPTRTHAKDERVDILHTSIIKNESRFDDECFQGSVISRLPYARHTFQNNRTFNKVAIDNEQLVGIRCESRKTVEIEVLHIG